MSTDLLRRLRVLSGLTANIVRTRLGTLLLLNRVGLMIALGTIVGPSVSNAQSVTHTPMSGSRPQPCDSWLESRAAVIAAHGPPDRLARETQFILGFLTAMNHGVTPTIDLGPGSDESAVLPWVDSYCRRYPSENVALASRALFRELTRRSSKHLE